jgi:hypothetical protein
MKQLALLLVASWAAGPLAAQSFTGEFRLLGVGAYAPSVSAGSGNQDPMGPPRSSPMAGVMGDLSFIAGRFRLGPEGFVLRGPDRRVWALGGAARYELGGSEVRPFAVAGAGLYWWDREILIDVPPTPAFASWGSDVNAFSLSGGAGLSLGTPGGRLAGISELRFHRTFKRPEFTGARTMVSLALGARIAW